MHNYKQPSHLAKMKTKKVTQKFKMLVSLRPMFLPLLAPKGLKSLENINTNPQSIRGASHQLKEVPPLCKLQE